MRNLCSGVKLKEKDMSKLQIDSKATEFLGTAFVAFPRSVFSMLFLSDGKGQKAGILYTALLSKVFFAKGHMKLGKKVFDCNPGEYISSHQNLATYSGMKLRSYHNALSWLIEAGLVRTTPLLGGTRFTLPGYTQFGKHIKLNRQASADTASQSLVEAERRMGGRSMQFRNPKREEQD